MTSALIAGAGPVGLTLAVELARYGVPLRIVDRAAARSDKSRALAVWPRTLELLERAGLAGAFVAAGLKVARARILTGTEHLAGIDFAGIASAYPFLLILPQSETERLLETHLADLGVTVERQTELVEFTDTAHGVTCTLRHADGTTETARADRLIGCDGARSTVRTALGLAFAGDTLDESFVLADVRVAGAGPPADELSIYWSAEGMLLLFPLSQGRTRVIADVSGEPRHEPALAEMQAIVDARGPGGVTLTDPSWLSGFVINERMVRDYRSGRVFLAGDAAHIHSPAGGQGMNTGMHDAINLGWKLALVHLGRAAPQLLDSYTPERAPVAREVLADSGRMTRAATLRNPVAMAMRNFVVHRLLGFEGIRNRGAARMSELTVRYPRSPLNRGAPALGASPAPGDRIVAGAPFGAGATPLFAVLADDGPEARAFLRTHAGLVEPALRAPLPDGLLRLVRPDGYVAAVAPAGDWTDPASCLEHVAQGTESPPPPLVWTDV